MSGRIEKYQQIFTTRGHQWRLYAKKRRETSKFDKNFSHWWNQTIPRSVTDRGSQFESHIGEVCRRINEKTYRRIQRGYTKASSNDLTTKFKCKKRTWSAEHIRITIRCSKLIQTVLT